LVGTEEWDKIVDEINNCMKCRLSETRVRPVPGEGPLNARILLIGEAPGEKEDLAGKPFVGAAGKLLDLLLERAGLRRSYVFITNIVKCRPPGNRKPRKDEILKCAPYLIRQIRLLKPKVVILLGNTAAETVMGFAGLKWNGVMKDHGKIVETHIFGLDVVLIPTFHPAATLYNPKLRKILEEDFGKVIREKVEEIQHLFTD